MDNILESDKNEKLLELLNKLDEKYIEERKNIIDILDDKYKPILIDVLYKNGRIKVNLFDKTELESFYLDNTDMEEYVDKLGKIINKKIDTSDFNMELRMQDKEGGKLNKYRKNRNYQGFGLKF